MRLVDQNLENNSSVQYIWENYHKGKGCFYFYELLNNKAKTDGWFNMSIKLEVEFSEIDRDSQYESEKLKRVVSEIIKMPYLNRLKQFMLRLHRNNPKNSKS